MYTCSPKAGLNIHHFGEQVICDFGVLERGSKKHITFLVGNEHVFDFCMIFHYTNKIFCDEPLQSDELMI